MNNRIQTPSILTSDFVDIDYAGYRGSMAVRIEYQWFRAQRTARPLLVFLHEGLGSVAMWKEYPWRLCEAGDFRGLIFSRPGYGRSSPWSVDDRWSPQSMHIQAQQMLPALFDRLGIADARPWLFGHSDGDSIALIYGATYPDRIAGMVVLAPHIFVEDLSISSIEQARLAYLNTDWRDRLRRYHDDPDSAFWGWNDAWLAPSFRDWNIELLLPQICVPILAVQGVDDEYGSMAQVEGIHRLAQQCTLLKLNSCGHSLHRDQAERLTNSIVNFIQNHSPSAV